MAARYLEDWLRGYMEYVSIQEAPAEFHFWTGVSTIAATLRRKVTFDQTYYTWSPNFYIVLVAPPGVSKSSAINIGMSMLDDIQGIRRGPDAITWQSLVQSMESATEMVPMPDGTFLAISCLTFASSELGSLLDPEDRMMLDVLTDLWDGHTRVWEKQTKTCGGNRIANPWINIIAGTTPSWIASNMPRTAIGGGFASRCIFVYAERKHHLMAYPRYTLEKCGKFTEMEKLRTKLLHDLEQIALISGNYELDSSAVEAGEKWYEEHYASPPTMLAGDEQFAGYMNRKQGHIHKLAMVLSAAKGDSLTITRDTLEAAIKIVSSLETAMPEVFRYVNTTDQQAGVMRIIEKVRALKGSVPKDTLYRIFLRQMSHREYSEALQSAVMAGELRPVARDNTIFIECTKP